ncbi:MAG: Asp23/Gls24 family envelope stress response protein [Clostridia bacterium]|nr:Asp23/Gls24 family envelope stress response protein [Clostridia bacterium]
MNVEIANNLTISEDVIGIIAGIAAAEVEGVSGMTLGLVDGINQILGSNKKYSKGVKIELNGNNVVIDLFVIVRYGVRIPDVAFSIQNSVKTQVETMTGLNVESVNINVQGVTFDKVVKKNEDEE